MAADINLMRRNWRIASRFWLEVDGWPSEDVEAAKAAIKQCADGGDEALLECWFNYLAETVEVIKQNPEAIRALSTDRNTHGSATV